METPHQFFIPALNEWMLVDQDEVKTIGIELYLNKLWQLGCSLVAYESGAEKELRHVLAGLPFVYDELVVHLSLVNDGWVALPLSKAESLNCMCSIDTLGRQVSPLFKKLGWVDAVHDANGITFYWGKTKAVYSSPLPF